MLHRRKIRGLFAAGVLPLAIGLMLALATAARAQQVPVPPLPAQPPVIGPQKDNNGASVGGDPKQQPKALYFQMPNTPPGDPSAAPPAPGTLPPRFNPSPVPAPPPAADAPAAPKVRLSIRSRYGRDLQFESRPLGDGTTAVILIGGGAILITNPDVKGGNLDIEADRIVVWTRSSGTQLMSNMQSPKGDQDNAHELYLAGNVEIRTSTKTETETVRADEVYYDVRRNVAVARRAELELRTPKIPYSIYVSTPELIQENAKMFRARSSSVFSSLLPSDPSLRVDISDLTVEEIRKPKKRLFGTMQAYDSDGKPVVETLHMFTGRNTFFKIEGWPVFYFPYLRGRVDDPLGPLENVGMNYNGIFGFQLLTTWDLFDIFGLDRPNGQRWYLNLDYMTQRGFAIGTEYEIAQDEFLGMKARSTGFLKLYGLPSDRGNDILGGDRGNFIAYPNSNTLVPIVHPDARGWAYGKMNVQELPYGFSAVGQFSLLSDRNFLEQYFQNIHLNDLDQTTYLKVKQQQDNWAWSIWGQVSTRDWMTQTEWLPRADGYLLGQTFLDDWFVYNAHASAGYARLKPATQVPLPYLPTDVASNTARLDLIQDISLPFYLGAFKVAPYLVGDLTYYSQDVNGDSLGRLYGAAGVRWSLPFSRLFPDIQSEIFNVDGIYHKMTFTGNFYAAQSSTNFNNLPQLDRLNDDVSDQALRDIRPWQTVYNPANAAALTMSNMFNPQYYALRRLVDNSVDTLDTIEVLQMGLRQRWQTKRGPEGNEHVVDWMVLNLGASWFPNAQRDNFGNSFGIFEYDWLWNIGDRTALTSSGWIDPFAGGGRTFDVGAIINRPDTTNFYIGYRQIDPIESKAVIAALTYPFNGKYAMTAGTVWDFGVGVQTYTLMITRKGTDLTLGLGVNYNSTVNTFSFNFQLMPNLASQPGSRAVGLFSGPQQQLIDEQQQRLAN